MTLEQRKAFRGGYAALSLGKPISQKSPLIMKLNSIFSIQFFYLTYTKYYVHKVTEIGFTTLFEKNKRRKK